MAEATDARVALITGCSSGIGDAVARRLVSAGWTVYASARRTSDLEALETLGCRALALDVDDERSMEAAVGQVLQEAGHIDALVNNAGYAQYGPVEGIPLERVRQQFETNVFGAIRLTQLVIPAMRARGRGRIVLIGSMVGRMAFPAGGVYSATKHALEALADALRFELRGFGIEVILVRPGLIRTRFARRAQDSLANGAQVPGDPYATFTPEAERVMRESYERGPVARLAGRPERVADVVFQALTTARPRTRYRVTPSATFFLGLRSLLPDRLWDAFLARSFPRPRKQG